MKKCLVALEGLPGSGKTTVKSLINIPSLTLAVKRIDQILPNNPDKDEDIDLESIIQSDYMKTKAAIDTEYNLVIFDRYYHSTLAYQYAYDKITGENTYDTLKTCYEKALLNGKLVCPDYTFYIDIPIEESIKRKGRVVNDNVWSCKDFLSYQREYYLSTQGLYVIDGKLSQKYIKSKIEDIIEKDMSNKIINKTSAGGVLYDRGKYLLIYWKSEDKYELPKGTIDKNETRRSACIREMLEETGYNVNITDSLGSKSFTFEWKDGNTYKKTVYYYLTERTDNLASTPNREENEDFDNLWLKYEDAIKIVSFDDLREILVKAKRIIDKKTKNLKK